jgi:hypothetical protein
MILSHQQKVLLFSRLSINKKLRRLKEFVKRRSKRRCKMRKRESMEIPIFHLKYFTSKRLLKV